MKQFIEKTLTFVLGLWIVIVCSIGTMVLLMLLWAAFKAIAGI